MPCIRIAALGAFALVCAAGPAAAQAETAAAGKPLQLLQFTDHKPAKPPVRTAGPVGTAAPRKPHAHVARHAKSAHHHKVAAAAPASDPAAAPAGTKTDAAAPNGPTAATPAANIWPDPSASTAGGFVAAAPSPAPVVKTEPKEEPAANEIHIDGQTVQVASPAEVNPIDLAADDSVTADKTAPSASGDAKSAVRAMRVSPSAPPGSITRASWMAQVLGAAGGAVAAGLLAWFLMRPRRQHADGDFA